MGLKEWRNNSGAAPVNEWQERIGSLELLNGLNGNVYEARTVTGLSQPEANREKELRNILNRRSERTSGSTVEVVQQ